MAFMSCSAPCAENEEEVVKSLKEHNSGDAYIISLIMSGCCTAVQKYFESGADINAKIGPRTPLFAALCVENNAAMANMLLNMGADVNAGYPHPETAIVAACFYAGNDAVVQRMVDLGAKGIVEAVIESIKNGYSEYLDILLPHISDINNVSDCFGDSVDLLSIKPHGKDMAAYLLRHGLHPKKAEDMASYEKDTLGRIFEEDKNLLKRLSE